MAKLRLSYGDLCEGLPAGFEDTEEYLVDVVRSALEQSQLYLENSDFLTKFSGKPDTIQTQVDMYADLLDYICANIEKELFPLLSKMYDGTEYAHENVIKVNISVFNDLIRTGFGQLAMSEVVRVDDKALFEAYAEERGRVCDDEKLNHLWDYTTEFAKTLKIPESSVREWSKAIGR